MCELFCIYQPIQQRLNHRRIARNVLKIVHPDKLPHGGMIEILPDSYAVPPRLILMH